MSTQEKIDGPNLEQPNHQQMIGIWDWCIHVKPCLYDSFCPKNHYCVPWKGHKKYKHCKFNDEK